MRRPSMRSTSSAQALGQSCGQTLGTMSSGKGRLQLDPTAYRDGSAGSRSAEPAPRSLRGHNLRPPESPNPRSPRNHNHRFHQNCSILKSAADLQRTLFFWLYRSPGRRSRRHCRDRLRFARGDDAAASAEVTAFIAAETSAAFSIGGNSNLTARSRHGGKMRSMQSRSAVGSPASASSTALRVKASDSPSSSTAAASVFLLRAPTGRPAGCPTGPLQMAARAPAPAVKVLQSSGFPLFDRQPFRAP